MKIDNSTLKGQLGVIARNENLKLFYYSEKEDVKKVLRRLKEKQLKVIACDIETTGFYAEHDMLGIVFGISEDTAIYVNTRGWGDKMMQGFLKQVNDLGSEFIFHNSLFDSSFTGIRYGVPLKVDHDTLIMYHTMMAHRQYYNQGLGLKELTRDLTSLGDYEKELDTFKKDYKKEHKIKASEFHYGMIPDDILIPYALFDGIATMRIYNKAVAKIEQLRESGKWTKLGDAIKIKTRANQLYIDAKIRGIKVDIDKVHELYEPWSELRAEKLELVMKDDNVKEALSIIRRGVLTKAQKGRKSIMPLSRCRKLWRETNFNLNSNKHKEVLFFEVMGIESDIKTKTGNYSVGKEFIDEFKDSYEIIGKIEEYSKVHKGITGFLGVEGTSGLVNLVDKNNYVHSANSLAGQISSRCSSKEPNLSQVPSKGELKNVKKCYVVEEGYKYVMFDFSAMEGRYQALRSGEYQIIDAYEKGVDTHSLNAFNVFKHKMPNLPDGDYNQEMQEIIKTEYKDVRQEVKEFCFGLAYGATNKAIGKALKISKEGAQQLIDTYYGTYSDITKMIDLDKEKAMTKGYIENDYGCRVYLKNCKGYNFRDESYKNYNYSAISEMRFTSNYVIQSSCALYFYNCLVAFFDEIKEKEMDVSLLTTIYDAIYIRVSDDEDIADVTALMYKHFEKKINGVVMEIDPAMSTDGTWYTVEDDSLVKYKPKDFVPEVVELGEHFALKN